MSSAGVTDGEIQRFLPLLFPSVEDDGGTLYRGERQIPLAIVTAPTRLRERVEGRRQEYDPLEA